MHAAITIPHPARHIGYVDSPDRIAGACAWVWHRAKVGANLAICGAGQPGFPLSGTTQARTEGRAQGQMEAIGNRPGSQVLFVDGCWTTAAHRGTKQLGAPGRRSSAYLR